VYIDSLMCQAYITIPFLTQYSWFLCVPCTWVHNSLHTISAALLQWEGLDAEASAAVGRARDALAAPDCFGPECEHGGSEFGAVYN
jgi:hypothetical protein